MAISKLATASNARDAEHNFRVALQRVRKAGRLLPVPLFASVLFRKKAASCFVLQA